MNEDAHQTTGLQADTQTFLSGRIRGSRDGGTRGRRGDFLINPVFGLRGSRNETRQTGDLANFDFPFFATSICTHLILARWQGLAPEIGSRIRLL